MGAVVEPRKRPHCNFKIKISSASAGLEPYELQRHRHAYRWGWHHVKAKSCH